MAGEQLLEMMKARGGADSEYADIVYGKVLRVKPLKISYGNQMNLTPDFLEVSDRLRNWTEKVKINGEAKKILHLNRLKKGDTVTMMRCDGGQRFFVFERKGR